MSDRRIQVFHAVAKHLSFTKAADALFMSQPAVTFQIHQLEDEFDTRLFDRTRGGVTLTPAGAVALEYADRLLAMSAELKSRLKEMSGRIGGQLMIGASTAYAGFLLPQLLVEFKSKFPAVVPRISIANSDSVQAQLVGRAFDIGFIDGVSRQPTLNSDVCCDDELQVVCAPSHPLAGLKQVAADELVRHPYVSREAGSGTRHAVDRYMQDCGLSPGALQVVMEVSSPEAVKALVAAGIGYSIMSWAAVVREVRLGELSKVPLAPRLLRQLSIAYPKERIQSRLINSFAAFARDRIATIHAEKSNPPAPLLRAVEPVALRHGKAVENSARSRRRPEG